MAAIQCPSCKAHLSVKGLVNCPLCQTFLDPAFLRERDAADARANRALLAAQSTMGPKEWLGAIVLVTIAVLVGLIIYRVAVPSQGQLHDRKISAALLACQQRIEGLAKYGGAETPPFTKNFGKGNEFYFAWPRGSFHFTNAFGTKEKMSASCIGEVDTGTIHQLTLNGQTIQ